MDLIHGAFGPRQEIEALRAGGRRDVRSPLVLPIYTDALLSGFVGFDDCSIERIWSISDVDALLSLAISLGPVLLTHQFLQSRTGADRIALGDYLLVLQDRFHLITRDRNLRTTIPDGNGSGAYTFHVAKRAWHGEGED